MSEFRLKCGCIPDASGYGYCGECTRKLRLKIWNGLSEGQRQYDRQFGGEEIAELERDYTHTYEQTCCSCHINAPCGYCESKNEDDEQYD
jgi:hypothetical protein